MKRCRICTFDILDGETTENCTHKVCLLFKEGKTYSELAYGNKDLLTDRERKFDLPRIFSQYKNQFPKSQIGFVPMREVNPQLVEQLWMQIQLDVEV